jgi:hypothetical protein
MNKAAAAVGAYIWRRLKEPSTWRGLALLATMAGVPAGTVDPILQAGLAVVGVLGTLPDPK